MTLSLSLSPYWRMKTKPCKTLRFFTPQQRAIFARRFRHIASHPPIPEHKASENRACCTNPFHHARACLSWHRFLGTLCCSFRQVGRLTSKLHSTITLHTIPTASYLHVHLHLHAHHRSRVHVACSMHTYVSLPYFLLHCTEQYVTYITIQFLALHYITLPKITLHTYVSCIHAYLHINTRGNARPVAYPKLCKISIRVIQGGNVGFNAFRFSAGL